MKLIRRICALTAGGLLLVCLVMIAKNVIFPAKPALPDPANCFSALGILRSEGTEVDGVKYCIYEYTFTKDASVYASGVTAAYREEVTAAGFQWRWMAESSDDTGSYLYSITRDGQTAYLALLGDYSSTVCTATLSVPKGMPFVPAENLQDTSSFLND